MEQASYHGALRAEAGRLRGRTAKAPNEASHEKDDRSTSERIKDAIKKSKYLTPVPQIEADRILQEYRLKIAQDESLVNVLYPVLGRITHTYRLDKKLKSGCEE
ncbi:MAG: hypothetical protein JW743_06375 [Deltaproteobacteria bacterium]|nr:hypothetical protein [Deltaproteobacteria bacterium]MBN2845299.1 hypothetical protein [Deltaproteobacteria bacterium]